MRSAGLSANDGRRLLPGVGSILFAAQLNLMLVRATPFLNDPGTGWHLLAGRLMLDEKRWIVADPFSFTHGGEPWITFEWLSQVVFALVERAMGLGGLVWFGFSLFGLVPLLLFRWLLANKIPHAVAFAYAVTALLILQGHTLARPHVFTYLAFVLLCLVVGPRMEDGPTRRHWLALPPLFGLWANLHGGFVAGLVWLGARVVGFALDRTSGRGSLRGWSGLLMACAAGTLINPHGARLHAHIWEELVELKTVRYWMEFAPPDFYGPSLLAAVVLATTFVLLIGLRAGALADLPWQEFLPVLVFLFFSFKSQRHVFLLLPIASVTICRAVVGTVGRPVVLPHRWRRVAEGLREARGEWWAVPLLAVLFGAWLAASGLPERLRVGEQHLSKGAADFLAASLPRVQRPLTTSTTGGPVLYYFFPACRVSFDDRGEFYRDRENLKFIHLFAMAPGWRATLSEKPFDAAILPPGMPLVQGLALLPEWREAYRDDVVVIFLHGPAERSAGNAPV
jgi:hypothetical protein